MSDKTKKVNGKDAASTTGMQTQKPELSNFEVIAPATNGKEKPEILSIEERISRVDQLLSLCNKREKIHNSLKKLEEFRLEADEESSYFRLQDKDGKTFQSSNPTVLKKVVDMVKAELSKSLASVEAEIIF